MLDTFIIEEIKRRERDRQVDDRPTLELPLPQPHEPPAHQDDRRDDERDRGVVIIDYN